jgi:hypothetical protein
MQLKMFFQLPIEPVKSLLMFHLITHFISKISFLWIAIGTGRKNYLGEVNNRASHSNIVILSGQIE